MAQYMLVLYDNPSAWAAKSPEEMQKALEKYLAWGARAREQGYLKVGHKLADDPGKVLRGSRVTDGPYSETKEVMGGYYLIDARSYDEAVARSREHPHLEFGGTIEVRVVEEMPPG